MKRRDFIQLSAFAAAAVSFPLLHACNSAVDHTMSKPVFLSRLFDEQTIKDTGKAYLQKTPSENDNNKLVQLLAGNSSLTDADEKTIHQYLDEQIKHDFETGNTVLVKGWVLAVTEARQCALFSLMRA